MVPAVVRTLGIRIPAENSMLRWKWTTPRSPWSWKKDISCRRQLHPYKYVLAFISFYTSWPYIIAHGNWEFFFPVLAKIFHALCIIASPLNSSKYLDQCQALWPGALVTLPAENYLLFWKFYKRVNLLHNCKSSNPHNKSMYVITCWSWWQ
jgi:hypothetical protein